MRNGEQAQSGGRPVRLHRSKQRNQQIEDPRLPRWQTTTSQDLRIQPPGHFSNDVLIENIVDDEPGTAELLDDFVSIVTTVVTNPPIERSEERSARGNINDDRSA